MWFESISRDCVARQRLNRLSTVELFCILIEWPLSILAKKLEKSVVVRIPKEVATYQILFIFFQF